MNITININADTIAVMSAVIALVAMIISWRQAHLAKQSLKMEKEIFNGRKPNFTFDSIVDCYAIHDNEKENVQLRFLVLITNRSDRPMTINQIILKIRGSRLN